VRAPSALVAVLFVAACEVFPVPGGPEFDRDDAIAAASAVANGCATVRQALRENVPPPIWIATLTPNAPGSCGGPTGFSQTCDEWMLVVRFDARNGRLLDRTVACAYPLQEGP
jgi:hypothetical protein